MLSWSQRPNWLCKFDLCITQILPLWGQMLLTWTAFLVDHTCQGCRMLEKAGIKGHCLSLSQWQCRCVAESGDEDDKCKFFARSYRSICPAEWVSPIACCTILVCREAGAIIHLLCNDAANVRILNVFIMPQCLLRTYREWSDKIASTQRFPLVSNTALNACRKEDTMLNGP